MSASSSSTTTTTSSSATTTSSSNALNAADGLALSNALLKVPEPLFPSKRDSLLERAVIYVLSFILSRRFFMRESLQRESQKYLRWNMTFRDFSSLTKLLLRQSNGSIDELQTKIVSLLNGLIPPRVKAFFAQEYAKNARIICEQSGEWIQRFGLLGWLIGAETERYHIEVKDPLTGDVQQWQSGLQVKQCRYLLESGCKSACVNVCKIPTQRFFNDVIGLPLTMTPDYADLSCKFEFGLKPLPKEEDPAFQTACFLGCSLSAKRNSNPCGL